MIYYNKGDDIVKKRKAIIDTNLCVACGSCLKVCPKDAIGIFYGQYAIIKDDLCIGCGKCTKDCPASVISIEEVHYEENKELV